jgi:hypothetical protein
MRLTTFLSVSLAAVVATAQLLSAQDESPKKLSSPDGKYLIELLEEALPGADSLDDFTLVLSSNGKPLAKVSTFGFLTAAHWSEDGKYVAVNNRRGNSGDYVWVFELATGKALKQPDDTNGEAWEKAAAKAVRKQLPSANADTLIRDWVTAQGWKDGHLQLVVRSVYRGAKKKFDFQAAVDPATWQIKTSQLVARAPDAD